jgi:hypothetical protein
MPDILSAEQITQLWSAHGSLPRDMPAMLQAAARLGYLAGMNRAAEICDQMALTALMPEVRTGRWQCEQAIRAEAG